MRIHDLKVELVPLELLTQHPENANNGDVDAIEESMEINGVYDAIKVQRSTGRIIAGNHRYLVAMKRQMKVIPVIYLDVTDEQALRIMLADNSITRHGFDDEPQLLNLLDSLYATDLGLHGTGFSVDHREKLNSSINETLRYGETAGVDERLDHEPAANARRYSVTPQFDEDGNCYELSIAKAGMGTLTKSDANSVRKALGLDPFTDEEFAAFGEGGWR